MDSVNRSYLDYYDLDEPPFGLAPNPRFVYHSRSHSSTVKLLVGALDRGESLIVITGEIGTGKTTICRTLLRHLPPRTMRSVILNPFLTGDDFLKQVLFDFGAISSHEDARPSHASGEELAATLGRFLRSSSALDGRAVIMIDEAQELGARVLEQVGLLSNLETGTAKRPQIILVGQPGLNRLLQAPALVQLNHRVACRCHLEPLAVDEVGPYIERRLTVARGDSTPPVQFTPAAVRVIAALSRGIPRVVNFVCNRSLEIGCERRRRIIGCRIVLAAAGRRSLLLPASRRQSRGPALLGTATPLMLAAAAVGGWVSGLFSPNVHDVTHGQGDTVKIIDSDTRRITFRTRAFGYDKAQVRDLLSNLIEHYEQALEQVETLSRQLNRRQGESGGDPTPPQHDTTHHVERILVSANRVADEIRKEAERDAARLLTDAEARAARLVEEAATEATRKAEAAINRLRAVEREIERMQACHREVRSALESAVTSVGATLADVSAFTLNLAGHDGELRDDLAAKLEVVGSTPKPADHGFGDTTT